MSEPVGELAVPAASRAGPRTLAYVALWVGVLALCFSSLFVRWADAPGMITSFYRMVIASTLLLPVFLHAVRRPGARRMEVRYMWLPLLAGVFSALDHGIWSTAMGYTRLANATLLNNISPLWVALVAWLAWKEKLTGKFWLGLALALLGVGIVFGNDLLNNPHLGQGDLLAIFSSFFFAGYFLVTQRGREHFQTIPYMYLAVVSCAISLLVFNLIVGHPFGGYSLQTILIFFAAAVVSQITGYFALTYAMGHLPAVVVSPTMVAMPVITAVMAIPLVGESLAPAQWIGGLVVMLGVYLVNRR